MVATSVGSVDAGVGIVFWGAASSVVVTGFGELGVFAEKSETVQEARRHAESEMRRSGFIVKKIRLYYKTVIYMTSINHEGKRNVSLDSKLLSEFTLPVKCIDIIESSETDIIYEYLWDGAHPTFFREFHYDFGSGSDIDLLITCPEGIEEIFCLDAVGAVVLGVDGDHSIIEVIVSVMSTEAKRSGDICLIL